MGVTSSMTVLLQNRGASYADQTIFSIAVYPFMSKFQIINWSRCKYLMFSYFSENFLGTGCGLFLQQNFWKTKILVDSFADSHRNIAAIFVAESRQLVRWWRDTKTSSSFNYNCVFTRLVFDGDSRYRCWRMGYNNAAKEKCWICSNYEFHWSKFWFLAWIHRVSVIRIERLLQQAHIHWTTWRRLDKTVRIFVVLGLRFLDDNNRGCTF